MGGVSIVKIELLILLLTTDFEKKSRVATLRRLSFLLVCLVKIKSGGTTCLTSCI